MIEQRCPDTQMVSHLRIVNIILEISRVREEESVGRRGGRRGYVLFVIKSSICIPLGGVVE